MEVPVSRNALCPCGSGKRYKACHGAWEGAGAARVSPATAQARLEAKDYAGAAAAANEVLAQQPEQPEALRILAQVAHQEGRPEDALPLLLRAARALPRYPLPAAAQYAVWTGLNFMFTQVLSGLDAVRAGSLRADYHAAAGAAPAAASADTASLVIVAGPDPERLRAALAAAMAQTWRPLEIVVVHPLGIERPSQPPAHDAGITWQWIEMPVEAGVAARINAGVRASRGANVALLEDVHQHEADRVAAVLSALGRRNAQWGFSDVRFVTASGAPAAAGDDPRVARLRTLLEAIPEADTVGHALFHHDFVAVDAGNLVFRRTLFDALDGFRELPTTFAWDFALRALWLAEPVYVPRPLYVHRLLPELAVTQAERERAQVEMFGEYYARATSAAVPPNPFAPSMAVWGLHFLKTPFQTGHVLAFPADELDRVAALIIAARKATAAETLTAGINLVGFAFGEFGLGESLRALAAACETGGIPFVVKDVDMRLRSRQADRTVAPHVSDVLRHWASLYCVNPDMLQPVQALLTATTALGGRNIGYWYWELETLPKAWDDALARMDEVWVATEFVAMAVRRACDLPVVKIPPPIEVRLSRPYTRAEFALPEDRFLFLFSFDFNSFSKRKNPEAAIIAFKQAFPPGCDYVGLVVKSINGTLQPEKMEAMLALGGTDDRIFLRDGFLSRDAVFGLESVVDAYVSLHRAEGLGLGLAESMYLGKPVIGTAYSGNLEFMTPENSGLVGYRMVPILQGEYLYDDPRFEWADPDVDEAAHLMRRLVDDAAFRSRLAAAGQRTVRERFNRERTASLIRDRLETLGIL